MSRTGLTLACLATVAALAACGSDDEPGRAPRPPRRRRPAPAPAAETTQAKPSAADGVTPRRRRHVRRPASRHRATRRHAADLRRRAGRHDPRDHGRQAPLAALPRHPRQGDRGGEQGLLSIAFAPDYAKTRRFYVNYTDRGGTQSVVEYRRSKSSRDRADAGSARRCCATTTRSPTTTAASSRSGPDKMLYIGTGDGGGANDQHGERGNAQNLGSLLGKLLRIDPRRSGGRAYRVPPSNPFVGRSGARPRDLLLRAAQPVALLLRPPDRRPHDRRRRPERRRGGRLRDEGRGARGELRLAAVGGHAAELPRARAGRGRARHRALARRRQLLDHRRPRRPRRGRPGAVGPLRLRRPLRRPAALGEALGRLGAGRRAIPGLAKVEQLSSFGEDARGRVYVTSLSGPVYRLAAG